MIGMPGPLEICIVAAIMLLLFGNKFPSRMRALGASITEFKRGLNGESESS
jgi:TatA/E family protein of Tat protein translocase